MDERSERYYEKILFDLKTSYRTEYRYGFLKPVPPCQPTVIEKRLKKPPETVMLKDLHTMSELKTEKPLDFTLFHRPRPIIDTDPRVPDTRDVKLTYSAKLKHTGMRAYPPGLDIEKLDPESRKAILDYIYDKPKPFITKNTGSSISPARADVTNLRKVDDIYVSEEWRHKLVEWDKSQLRAYVDQDREFWKEFMSAQKLKHQ